MLPNTGNTKELKCQSCSEFLKNCLRDPNNAGTDACLRGEYFCMNQCDDEETFGDNNDDDLFSKFANMYNI